jgi:hypothetical protein
MCVAAVAVVLVVFQVLWSVSAPPFVSVVLAVALEHALVGEMVRALELLPVALLLLVSLVRTARVGAEVGCKATIPNWLALLLLALALALALLLALLLLASLSLVRTAWVGVEVGYKPAIRNWLALLVSPVALLLALALLLLASLSLVRTARVGAEVGCKPKVPNWSCRQGHFCADHSYCAC